VIRGQDERAENRPDKNALPGLTEVDGLFAVSVLWAPGSEECHKRFARTGECECWDVCQIQTHSGQSSQSYFLNAVIGLHD
jgi:hypothetical protein